MNHVKQAANKAEAIKIIMEAIQLYKDKGDYKVVSLSIGIGNADVLKIAAVKTSVHNVGGKMLLGIDSFHAKALIPMAAVSEKTVDMVLEHSQEMSRMCLIFDKGVLAAEVSDLILKGENDAATNLMLAAKVAVQAEAKGIKL